MIFCSFGDMLRVPGSAKDLFQVKSQGGDVRVVYSPLDALKIAKDNPDKQVVFFGIGFETTAPANAMTVYEAKRLRHRELLAAGVARAGAAGHRGDHGVADMPRAGVPRRRARLLRDGHRRVPAAVRQVRIPIVVTGFEPLDILEGIRRTVMQLESGRHELENAYPRAVQDAGNLAAKAMLLDVFEVTDRAWRGIGMIPQQRLAAVARLPRFDAEHRFAVTDIHTEESAVCRSGEVLQGLIKPHECEAFGTLCTPRNPLGATMVSSEGACAAYYLYRRLEVTNA